MAGANMSHLWHMCSKLFREIKEDELVPGHFDSPPAKKAPCAEAEQEETKAGEATGVINPSGSTNKVYTDQLLIPHAIWVFLPTICHTGSPSKKRELRGVTSQSLIIAVCSVTTSHRTEHPPLLTPIITLMLWLLAIYAHSPVSPQDHWRTTSRRPIVASFWRKT